MKKILLSLLCIGMLVGCSSKNDETANIQPKDEYQQILNEHKHYKAGLYQVGKDFKAGEYCLFDDNLEDNNVAQFSLRKEEYSDGESILDDGLFVNHYILLKEGEYIEFENAVLFDTKDMPGIMKDNTYCMFKVGKDIEAGNYIAKPIGESSCITIYLPESENKKYRQDLVDIEVDFTNEKKIKLKNGQYVDVENCSLMKQN